MKARTLQVLLGITLAGFVGIIVWAANSSPFLAACSSIWAEPWGRVMLADLYIGFALFAAWIGWRERSWLRGGLWFAAICVLGNAVALVYLLWALYRNLAFNPTLQASPITHGQGT